MADSFDAFFLPAESGGRFCIYHPPLNSTRPRGGVVYVHPFAEEMNKSRRMAALQSRRLAAAGTGVLQIDLYGCGDSAADFGEARWEIWNEDVLCALRWLGERVPGPLGLWGLRLGATLAAAVAREAVPRLDRMILWQPVASGEQFLTQFLRLYLASEMLGSGAAQTGVRELRDALARGDTLEIAGYRLHSELALAIDGLRLADLVPATRTAIWQEVSARPDPQVTPASQRVLDAWRAGGVDVRTAAVTGEPFWSTLEITDCPALLDATDACLKAVD